MNKNVNGALKEALTSLAVLGPDDPVEFLGQYLLKFVDRKKMAKSSSGALEETEIKLTEYLAKEEIAAKTVKETLSKKEEYNRKFTEFLESVASSKSKESAMDSAVAFMEEHMNIPSAYVAVKRISGETESLFYLSASPSAVSSVRGKKLTKASAEEGGDEENPVERLGVSFEAFKLPEVPEEEEAAEPEEGAAPLPPKAAPVASPLVIDNAMRDKRCKFFGIPKLGAFVACPFSYDTLEHEAGCVFTPADADAGTEEGYALKKIPAQFIVAFDSVGAYRLFSPEDVAAVNQIGAALCSAFAALEEEQGARHMEFVSGPMLKSQADKMAEVTPKLAEVEAAALADAAKAFEVNPEQDPPAEEPHELKKPAFEAQMVSDALSELLGTEIASSMNVLQKHVLPLPAIALHLLLAVSRLVGINAATCCTDVCGEPSWPVMREKMVMNLAAELAAFKAAAPRMGLAKAATTTAIKAQAEALGLLDAAAYPPSLPMLGALATWLGKALAAREAYIAYSAEALQTPLESEV